MNDIIRYGSLLAIILNAVVGLVLFETHNFSAFSLYELIALGVVASIGVMGFLVLLVHAMSNDRRKWALGIFFLGPPAQLCYWLFFVFADGRDRDPEEIAAVTPDEAGWSTPPPSAPKRRKMAQPSIAGPRLVKPNYVKLGM